MLSSSSAILRVHRCNIPTILILLGSCEGFQLITIATTDQHGTIHITSSEGIPEVDFASFCLI